MHKFQGWLWEKNSNRIWSFGRKSPQDKYLCPLQCPAVWTAVTRQWWHSSCGRWRQLHISLQQERKEWADTSLRTLNTSEKESESIQHFRGLNSLNPHSSHFSSHRLGLRNLDCSTFYYSVFIQWYVFQSQLKELSQRLKKIKICLCDT